ncbi:MAG: UDP-N-acetylglucosamine 1-carboxyvinyltransferase [Ruminococcus sp.]|nr:UDP-N-acetylglucosamine 1-carboxyvinyltransferase [Ruminococcus sp.]
MQKLVIDGGKKLSGELKTQGAKNAVLPVLAACTLCKEEIRLANCPLITDRYGAARILTGLGARVTASGNDMTADCSVLDSTEISAELMRSMRSSIIFMGALLGREGKCTLCYPGGCDLGPRPIDMHISALEKMGASITDEHGIINCTAPKGLTGCKISLSFPSVGATENIMLAAVLAKGETVISNSAREPEICCLADFLRQCGARIKGDGGGRIVIEGCKSLHSPDEPFAIIPDRIAAATYLSAAVCAGGELMVTDCCPAHLEAIIPVFEQMGAYIRSSGSNIYIRRDNRLKAADTIRTMVYPGFPTDLQAVMMSPLCTAEGTTVFVENIFDNRYRHVDALTRMGANIKAEGKVAVVTGVSRLYGAAADAPDLRGGAAIVCAALGAQGETAVSRTEYIDRGYESIEKNLSSVGAKIKRYTS